MSLLTKFILIGKSIVKCYKVYQFNVNLCVLLFWPHEIKIYVTNDALTKFHSVNQLIDSTAVDRMVKLIEPRLDFRYSTLRALNTWLKHWLMRPFDESNRIKHNSIQLNRIQSNQITNVTTKRKSKESTRHYIYIYNIRVSNGRIPTDESDAHRTNT